MEKLTDWTTLWKELSDIQSRAFSKKQGDKEDCWRDKARDFDKMVEKRWAKPDSSRQFLLDKLSANPGSSLLDIGAGTGKWSVLAASHAAKITALEPSPSMQAVLKEKIDAMKIPNIDIFTGAWPEDDPGCHDFILASHSMYGIADFPLFVTRMCDFARRGCILVMRAPFADSIMAKAAMQIWGQPYDSPNFQIAYNILLGMDIYPDVIMEADGTWPAWTSDSFDDAMEDIKTRLDLDGTTVHDVFLWDLLAKHLTKQPDGSYVWPAGNRSALVYWDV
jgi:precorrin-6B methylase 2